ncbi:hypothetical protein K461DRAFT_319591 [Myriangium duriaei CBS 260.36]|uniref:Uncharacterized protein n=1 Tax=Myriangium duriaei CBS 260.36 TaxID=1168546 RepID=A0A9P4JA79_9PEZI|nr:hypothetical protein K461DRAFT_319591 [Myriangium duriaei CBS 260.36]
MSMMMRRAAFRPMFRTTRPLRASGTNAGATDEITQGQRDMSKNRLKEGAKRDPELYILLAIMSGAFGLAGWYFSRHPTSSSSEHAVSKVPGSEPWKTGSEGPYEYHPGGDTSKQRKSAPSALNEVIIPNVNLPKDLHDRYNKWGKEGY